MSYEQEGSMQSGEQTMSRRSLFKKGLALGMVAAGAGIVDNQDRDMSPSFAAEQEATTNPDTIIPIFAMHLTGGASSDKQFEDVIDRIHEDGELPDRHSWPKNVEKKLEELQPSVIAIDGDVVTLMDVKDADPNNTYKNLRAASNDNWFYQPGNLFDIKRPGEDLFFVEGDLPYIIDGSYQFQREYIGLYDPQDVAITAYKEYFENITKKDFDEDINIPLTQNEIDNLHDRYVKETVASIGGAALFSGRGRELMDKAFRRKTTRRGFNKLSALFGLNAARLTAYASLFSDYDPSDYPHPNPFDQDAAYDITKLPASSLALTLPATKGIFNYLDFREAAVSAKTREVRSVFLKDEKLTGPTAAIWGSAHQFGEDHWSNVGMTKEIIAVNLDKILGQAESIIDYLRHGKGYNTRVPSQEIAMTQVVGKLVRFLGATGVSRFSSDVQNPMLKDFVEGFKPQGIFISETIKKALIEAAQARNIPLNLSMLEEELSLPVVGPKNPEE